MFVREPIQRFLQLKRLPGRPNQLQKTAWRSGDGDEVVEERPRVGDVEAVVPAEAPAELAGAEAGVADEVPALEHGTTRVAEARTTAGAGIVGVLGQLEDLRRRHLPDRLGEPTAQVADGGGLLGALRRLVEE